MYYVTAESFKLYTHNADSLKAHGDDSHVRALSSSQWQSGSDLEDCKMHWQIS